jgi:hypothetical protein
MHVRCLPPKVEVAFLSAMTFGASGLLFYNTEASPAHDLSTSEWTLGHQDTTFPFNERQCERMIEIYQVLQSK